MSQSKSDSQHEALSNEDDGTAFARALWKTVYKEERFTPVELAEEAGCSDRHIYKVCNGESTLSHEKAEKVSRYLGKHGDMRAAYAFVPPGARIVRPVFGEPNGSLTDDVMDIIKAATGIHDAAANLNTAAIRRFIDSIRSELADLEAELAELEGRR